MRMRRLPKTATPQTEPEREIFKSSQARSCAGNDSGGVAPASWSRHNVFASA
jgi:hypothetical protein